MFNFLRYKDYKDYNDKTDKQIEYEISLIEKMSSLYEITFENQGTKDYKILQYALLNGHCGFAKIDDKIYCGVGCFCGELDKDGLGKEYIITFQNGETYQGIINKDIVILKWNNMLKSQFPFIQWFSEMLTDTDISMKYNILYTRVCPIPIVDNDIEEKSMGNILDKLFSGKMQIFKRSTAQSFFNDSESKNDKTLNLTNPQASTYMQNLSRFHDELILRFCLEMGVYVSARDKGAQLNETELNSFKDYCAISADDTYSRLLEFKEDMKNVFNVDVEIKQKSFVYTEKDVEKDESEDNHAS